MQDGTSHLKDLKSTKKSTETVWFLLASYELDPELGHGVSARFMVSIVDDMMKQEHHRQQAELDWICLECSLKAT
jgi:hypothetical protein